MTKKDKEKVLDEVWTEDRIRSFLDLLPPAGMNADFHVLYSAYKSMRLEDFELFLSFFKEAGRDLNAQDTQGRTLAQLASQHRYGTDYANALTALATADS